MLKYKLIGMDKRMVEFHFLGRHSKYLKQQRMGRNFRNFLTFNYNCESLLLLLLLLLKKKI